MPNTNGRNIGLLILSAVGFGLLPVAAAAESSSESIGPWGIEATYKGDKFDRCTITRKLDDDIVVTFVRTGDDLTLILESPNWKLERGQDYPVKMNLGSQSWDREVAAEVNSVSLVVEDGKFERGLKNSNSLNIVAAGATIRVPLDKSNEALERLEQCIEKNERAVQTNPFVAPARRP